MPSLLTSPRVSIWGTRYLRTRPVEELINMLSKLGAFFALLALLSATVAALETALERKMKVRSSSLRKYVFHKLTCDYSELQFHPSSCASATPTRLSSIPNTISLSLSTISITTRSMNLIAMGSSTYDTGLMPLTTSPVGR